ncbi:uncharacterized protein LOC143880687 [Tasmannia lanceolata]|uniref:uncharacterized protein LOC143880687 n=1 Tax=Tasmannia lanceolata TaxID=3420 RepID=UPI0040633E3F
MLVLCTEYYENYLLRAPYESNYFTLCTFITHVIDSDEHCHNLLRMNVSCFRQIFEIFKRAGTLEDTIHCKVEEQVAIFLHIVAHNQRVRTIRACARRSGATISTYFNKVLKAILSMQDFFIKPPTGNFYLADGGYPLLRHFITAHRQTTYHLNEFRGRLPRTSNELFNHRHSSCQNVIDRTFGVLKKHFNILNEEPMYNFEKQFDIFLACCCIHNHIRCFMPNDSMVEVVDNFLVVRLLVENEDIPRNPPQSRDDEKRAGEAIRDTISAQMQNDFSRRHQR